MHVLTLQVSLLASFFTSSSLNCLFLHHCARFLFLSFSCCFLLIVSTSPPVFTGSLFLVLSPLLSLFVWLNGFISGFGCFRQMSATPYTISPLRSSCFLPLLPHYCSTFLMFSAPNHTMLSYISPSFFSFFFLNAHKFSPAGKLCLWVNFCKSSNND